MNLKNDDQHEGVGCLHIEKLGCHKYNETEGSRPS